MSPGLDEKSPRTTIPTMDFKGLSLCVLLGNVVHHGAIFKSAGGCRS